MDSIIEAIEDWFRGISKMQLIEIINEIHVDNFLDDQYNIAIKKLLT